MKKIPFPFLLIDIDYFKKFNDTYGHAGGDLFLAGFADKLKSAIRQMDTAGQAGDTVGVGITSRPKPPAPSSSTKRGYTASAGTGSPGS